MTTHDEKILQLLDRIHTTAQGRREKAVDGAVQTMERVNRTSYGALRDLTENGHKTRRPPAAAQIWHTTASTQELPVDEVPVFQAAAEVEPVTEVTRTEITLVMPPAVLEKTAVTAAPAPDLSPEERPHSPEEVVSGDGATYGGSTFQKTQIIWFRRLFRRR